uniref:RNA-directed DNA polymerase, eukaryota, reverse transcriptase zinc-binding domain protein n=1 Tax=Tanacetum cinerariifolium TaxID=118510 RepID=A0A6L2NVW9_TANCI|nr:hypothetical protein [Tanacetum cinerariifolium]
MAFLSKPHEPFAGALDKPDAPYLVAGERGGDGGVRGGGSHSSGFVVMALWLVMKGDGRGMNLSPKQSEVHHVIFENKLSVCAILESHVNKSNLSKVCESVFKHWGWTSNGNLCHKGTRILLGWNCYNVDVVVISQCDQAIHTHSIAGSSSIDIAMREFKECVDDIEVADVQSSGLQFTWNRKPKGFDGILKKLDRVLGNFKFNDAFRDAHAVFYPYRSDHSPAILKIPGSVKSKPKPFKFSNILTQHARFKEVVNGVWTTNVSGFSMYKVVKKLKCLKKPFRILLYEHGNLHLNVDHLCKELDQVQTELDSDPSNVHLRDKEIMRGFLWCQGGLGRGKAKVAWDVVCLLKDEGGLGLAAKIRNIDGKPLRSVIRNIVPSSGIDGVALHGNKASVDVNKSPSRVSFADNTRVSPINPNSSFIGKPIDTCVSSVENIWGPTTGIGGLFSMWPDVEMPANSVKDMMPAKPKHVQHNSFVSIVQKQHSKKVVKIKELCNDERAEGAAVAIPLDEEEAISSRFVNTLYGYFIGNRLAFPLVENYVKNTWAKYGLKLNMEYLVKIGKKTRILELKRRHLKNTVLTSDTPYPSRKIQCICACTSLDHEGNKINTPYPGKTNTPYSRYRM